MATKSSIRRSINNFIQKNSLLYTSYSNWYVGITNDVDKRLGQHQNKLRRELRLFNYWAADSARDAADLEREFHDKGLQGAGGGWVKSSNLIYVYKLSGAWA